MRYAIIVVLAFSLFVVGGAAAPAKEVVIAHFHGPNGSRPFSGPLVADAAGNLYGTTYYGGHVFGNCNPDGCGAVYELTPLQSGGWAESVIYAFRFGTDGFHPWGGVILDRAGDVFGTTQYGGAHLNGTVFELTPPSKPGGTWTKHALYNFQGGKDGAQPVASLTLDVFGDLFGTTLRGGFGMGCCGTAFKLTPPSKPSQHWTETVLYRFGGINDGDFPKAGMVLDAAGNLYGTTTGDLRNTFGNVFELSPPPMPGGAWTETDLFNFSGQPIADGFAPYGALIRDDAGNLYGTTVHGGKTTDACTIQPQFLQGCGTVFELQPPSMPGGAWTEVVLYQFQGGNDGLNPEAGLTANAAGDLFGTTGGPDFFPNGTVFELQPPGQGGGSWTETVLHDFGIGNDGYSPAGPPVIDAAGALVGGTAGGGGNTCRYTPPYCGIVYEITP
jgi:hypothetical protein